MAGGAGDRRFQQQLTIRGRVVKNGEIPKDLLAKVDFGGYLLEKHAAVKFSALNKAFKEKFGKNFEISGPYRTIDVGINIFDWDLFNRTGACRKKGSNGKTAAAKPGTSKHGWGQAMDIGGFGKGPGNAYFDWMEINAKKYGWINPAWAKKPGPGYEPWHWEYIGDDLFAA
jgi:LAS superfamily LD-carboxypeptidase LdcB